jgi:ABC-type phosphate transport system substrate-binding protein
MLGSSARTVPARDLDRTLVNKSYADARKAEGVRAFVGWGLRDGQQSTAELGYLPLPTALASAAQSALAAVR